MSSSVQIVPEEVSANRRMRAWMSFLAATFPVDTSCSKPARSSSVNVTRYLSMAIPRSLNLLLTTSSGDRGTCQSKIDGTLVFLVAEDNSQSRREAGVVLFREI